MNVLDIKTGVVSYDDFYLNYQEQSKLAEENPDNQFLQGRGVAGTHDMALGAKTIDDLCFGLDDIYIPRYNKSAYEGKGDRAEEGSWIKGPLDLVIVEGWMLGFQPIEKPTPEMEKVNELLSQYVKWEDRIDAAIIISAADNNYVYQWREQAEKMRRDVGEGAMSEADVKKFCDRFMPSYELYCPKLNSQGIDGVDQKRTLKFLLDLDRTPIVKN